MQRLRQQSNCSSTEMSAMVHEQQWARLCGLTTSCAAPSSSSSKYVASSTREKYRLRKERSCSTPMRHKTAPRAVPAPSRGAPHTLTLGASLYARPLVLPHLGAQLCNSFAAVRAARQRPCQEPSPRVQGENYTLLDRPRSRRADVKGHARTLKASETASGR